MEEKKNSIKLDSTLFLFFNKQLKFRTDSDIKKISKYLSQNYTYFINLQNTKDFNPQKIEKIIKYAKLEIIAEKTTIFNYGEPGDKFYILLQGSVSLYKPEYKEEHLTPYEFYEILQRIKEKERDNLQYQRILDKNSHVLGNNIKDISFLSVNKSYYAFHKKKFLLENMAKIGEFKEGFSFGEMALIRRTTRNATVRTNRQSMFITIGKKDYNNAIKELHDKVLTKDIDDFVKSFPIFNIFSKEAILEILNNLSRKTLYKGDYIYHMGDESSDIYFVKSGEINLSFDFSFAWIDEYFKFFNDNKGNMIINLINKKPNTFSELISIINKKKQEMDNKYIINFNPDEYTNFKKWEESSEKINKDNFLGIKAEEDKLNNEKKIFKINLKNVKASEIVGLEDAIECKKRFFTGKCISEHADLLIIKTYNLVKLCRALNQDQLFEFLGFILKRKDILTFQIINKVRYLEKDIIFLLNNKYDKLKGDENNIKTESDKNRMISLIKFKGFKTKINDLLDTKINIKDYIQTSTACKSLNLCMVNPTPKDAVDRNKQNMKLLHKIDYDINNNHHILKLKCNVNNINLGNKKKKVFLKNKIKISSTASFSPISTNYKTKVFSREKIYNSYNHLSDIKESSDNVITKTKNDFSYNLSPQTNSGDNKLFTKIFPNISKTQRKFFKEKSNNNILSPNKDYSSFNNTEMTDNQKIKHIHQNNQIQKKDNFFTKMLKKKFLNIDSLKFKENENSEENSKNLFSKEKNYYNQINKENKDFYLGERFRKKFMNEYTKIKPIKYHSFLLNNKNVKK
jgi:CRP-like cAMP-binding protein